jgi:hypothetical protein
MSDPSRELDRLLSSGGDVPEELASAVEAARQLEQRFQATVPDASRERALFIQAVAGSKRRPHFGRAFAPALAAAAVAGVIGFLAGSALPGDTLYPVRDVLGKVGLTDTAREEAAQHLDRASDDLDAAELAFQGESLLAARDLAGDALAEVNLARRLISKLDDADALRERADDLEEGADELIEDILDVRGEAANERGGDDVRDDNSGPGSVESGDDNSGPGSDDSGGDDSGSDGSGSDSGSGVSGGDNSGSGSDDSGSGDSGGDSGSNDSGGDDRSGSGSNSGDDSISGSHDSGSDDVTGDRSRDDSSGSGSGDVVDGSGSDDGGPDDPIDELDGGGSGSG